jgi:hypothetical protein
MTILILLMTFLGLAAEPLPGDEVLGALASRGDLRTFAADVTVTDIDAELGDETTRTGRVWLAELQGEPKLRVRFDERISNNKRFAEPQEFVLVGGVLHERDAANKRAMTRRIAEQGEVDLFALGEGPFPLPIGQPAAEVRRAFDVEPMPTTDAPQDVGEVSGVRLIPKPGSEMAEEFTDVILWVNLADGLPRQIITLDAQQTNERVTTFVDIEADGDVPAATFELPPVPADWRETVE